MATGTMPSAWASEDPEALATVVKILRRQAAAAEAAKG